MGAERSIGLRHWDTEVLVLQAYSRPELVQRARDLSRWLSASPRLALKDVAFTLNSELEPSTGSRLAIVASSLQEVEQRLTSAVERLSRPGAARIKDPNGTYFFQEPLGPRGKVALLFPGEGAQYPNMLADLCLHFPEMRAWFDLMDRAFVNHPRNILPSQFIFPRGHAAPDDETGHLWQMDGAVEAVFAANQALFALLRCLEVRADYHLGHSSGEYSALLASGTIQVRNDEQLIRHILDLNRVYERMAEQEETTEAVLLAVGGANRDLVMKVVETCEGPLYLALDNCPHQVILCGTPAAARGAAEQLRRVGAVCEDLPIRRAYHTPLFDRIGEPLREFFQGLDIAAPKTTLYSCTTAAPYPDGPAAIRELAVAQWSRPVRFRETIKALYEAGARIFLEVGPRGNLTAFVDDILRGRPYLAVALNVAQRSGLAQLNHAAALLAAHGVPLRLDYLYARRAPERLSFDLQALAAPKTESGAGMMELPLRLPSLRFHSDPAPLPLPTPALPIGDPKSLRPAEAPDGRPPTRTQVLQKYMQTMERFLATQQKVLQAYLGSDPNSARAPQALAAPGPFIRQVVSITPGRELIARCDLDLSEDLFLRQHTLAAGISQMDESLVGLPVMPLTVSMELLAEAASLLQPRRLVVGMKDIRAYRWLILEDERLSVELIAETAEGTDQVKVELREAGPRDAAQAPPALPLAQATVLFADAYPSKEQAGALPLAAERESKWPAGAMYERTGMFHGPLFRWVTQMDRTGEDGAEATLVAQSAGGFFRSNPNPTFLIDPVLLDAMGQVVGYWVGDHFERGLSVFPFKLAGLELFGPALRPGERAHCRVRVTFVDDERIQSNIDVVGPGGSLLARMVGWEDRRLDLPRSFYDFRMAPHQVSLSQVWSAPLAHVPTPDSLRCCCLVRLPENLFEAHGGIWLRVLSYMVLNRSEREVYRNLAPAKRRLEWLLGRIAAKDAARVLLRERYGFVLSPADIELTANGEGQPELRGAWLERLERPPRVSLAHTPDLAVALVGDGRYWQGVGIDIEKIDRINADVERVSFSVDEQELLSCVDAATRPEWLTRLWCAKEAVGKALGRGLVGGPLDVELEDLNRQSGVLQLVLKDRLAQERPLLPNCSIAAYTAREGDIALATAFISTDDTLRGEVERSSLDRRPVRIETKS